jgi:hypothetical protein
MKGNVPNSLIEFSHFSFNLYELETIPKFLIFAGCFKSLAPPFAVRQVIGLDKNLRVATVLDAPINPPSSNNTIILKTLQLIPFYLKTEISWRYE